ncbi:MAG: HAMP domain-containing histidine kinase, partial [Clostridia bacterium]|nr:HAMP domain-containing histidine kinase [Clostridia bacterium]
NLSCEEETQYVEKILYNTKRLSGLVGNILLLSKIENQAIQTHQTSFRLDEQIRQSIVILEPEWVKKDIEFDVEMEDIELISSENLLYHVWNNLIGNAIKFSPDGGIIHLRLFSDSDGILFSVQDHGPGISEESQKHIFDKFYQADSSHKQEGNGLGLALVKKILHLCGGEVSAENVPEGGCRFTVRMKQNAVGSL